VSRRYNNLGLVDPGLARLERSVERLRNRWRKPGRPSKAAIRERQRQERLREQGLLDHLGNPIPKFNRPPGRPKEKRSYRRRSRYKHRVGTGQAYCVKCKQARQLVYAHEGVLSNGRPALFGLCRTCRTRLCRTLPISKAASSIDSPIKAEETL